MQLGRKLDIVYQAIKSISEHRDEDAAVRSAALDRIVTFASEEKQRIDAEVKASIEAALS